MIEINNKRICESCFSEITAEPCSCCGFDKSTYINDPSVLPCGSMLKDRYIIGRVLGKGGFGITYLAYDCKENKIIAIKEYYPNGIAHRMNINPTVTVSTTNDANIFQHGAEKFYNEAKIVAKFNGNPAIVSVYEFFYENDTVYFSMEYLHGKTLKAYIEQNGAISEAQAVYIADCVSSALMVVHSANILHRDVSPDNIMLCDDGSVKLIDFGAARQLVSQSSQNLSVILKEGFAPIEQYQKKGKQGPWTDIYSFGATLYYALTGETLDDPMTRMEEDEDFQSNKHGISQPLWEVIRNSTMFRATERFQDIFLFRNALKATGITPVPIITPKKEEVAPITFQTAQPLINNSTYIPNNTHDTTYNTSITSNSPVTDSNIPVTSNNTPVTDTNNPVTNNENPVTSNNIPVTSNNTPVTADNFPETVAVTPPTENNNFPATVAMTPPTSQPVPVEEEPKPNKPKKKKPIMLIAIIAAAVVILGIGAVVLVNVLGDGDDTSISSSQEDTSDSSVIDETPELPSEPEPVVTKQSTTTRKSTTAANLPAQPGNKPWTPSESDSPVESQPEKNDEIFIAGEYYPANTKKLDLKGKNLKNDDIKDLKYFTSLTQIDLSDNDIDDLSVLGEIPTLANVVANNMNISDISFASKLPDLAILTMNDNDITDISSLKNCTKLKKVWLLNNPVKDISALQGKNLIDLGLSNAPVSDISAIKGMTKLTHIHMPYCEISDISALSSCTSLQKVYLEFNSISDYSPLVGLQHLEEVNLSGNVMNENAIKTLYGLSFLKVLYVNDMGITYEMAVELSKNLYSNDPDNATWHY